MEGVLRLHSRTLLFDGAVDALVVWPVEWASKTEIQSVLW